MADQPKANEEDERESGEPGGGAGRKDYVEPSGVHPMSGPHFAGDAPAIWPASWGQGKRGAEGYEDHGESELNFARVTPEKCRDIMTKDPVFCQASDSAGIAAKLMLKHDIGCLPVVDELHHLRVIGIVTDRDLAMKIVAAGRSARKSAVRDVMSAPVISCSPDDAYPVALDLMERYRIKRVPAVDDQGRVVGMISQADIVLRIPETGRIEKVVRSIDQPN